MAAVLLGTAVRSRGDTAQEHPWACSWGWGRGGEALSAPCPAAALGKDLWSPALPLWSPGRDVPNKNPPFCGHLSQQMGTGRWGVPGMLQLPKWDVGGHDHAPGCSLLPRARCHPAVPAASAVCVPLSPPCCQGEQGSRSTPGDASRKGHCRLLPAQETCLFIFLSSPRLPYVLQLLLKKAGAGCSRG